MLAPPNVCRTRVWRGIFCQGFDPKIIARALADRGILTLDGQGKFSRCAPQPIAASSSTDAFLKARWKGISSTPRARRTTAAMAPRRPRCFQRCAVADVFPEAVLQLLEFRNQLFFENALGRCHLGAQTSGPGSALWCRRAIERGKAIARRKAIKQRSAIQLGPAVERCGQDLPQYR